MSRIANIPRRQWEAKAKEMQRLVTAYLRTNAGTQTLFENQAVVLAEAVQGAPHGRGVFAAIEVGGGKTLLSAAIHACVQSPRPLTLGPGGKRKDTLKEINKFRSHWKLPPATNLQVQGYGILSGLKHRPRVKPDGTVTTEGAYLWTLRPTHIVLDEAHYLKDPDSVRTQVFTEYMQQFPETIVYALTGSFEKDDMGDYAHILRWTHKEWAPVPEHDAVRGWVDCLRETTFPADYAMISTHIGKCADPESACNRFQSRLNETPGVIISKEQFNGTNLTISPFYVEVPEVIASAIADVKLAYTAPDGWPLAVGGSTDDEGEFQPHGAEAHDMILQLATSGAYLRHDPWPPEPWMKLRSAWYKFVRDTIEGSFFKSELEVKQACAAGYLKSKGLYEMWRALEPTFTISKVPEVLSDHGVEYCLRWVRERATEGGIIWVKHIAFGERLSEATGWDYYHEGGRCGRKSISDASGRDYVIASISGCGTGFNLQQWNRALLTCPMTSVIGWQQVPGRNHRNLQTRDCWFDYVVACAANVDSFTRAARRAQEIYQSIGTPHNLLRRDVHPPRAQGIGPVWDSE